MRSDMAKLITECYRSSGSPYKNHRSELKQELKSSLLKEDYDILSKKESIRGWAYRSWSSKEFGEQLSPLRRFLLKSVGRLWNDVHSEMAEHINYNSTVQRHIWEHVFWYIEENTFIEDGKVYYYTSYYSRSKGYKSPIEDSYRLVYICPETGVLKAVPPKEKHKRRTYEHQYIILSANTQAHWIFGQWYKITLAKAPEPCFVDHDDTVYIGNSHIPKRKGRWVYPPFKDVATDDIKSTWSAIWGDGLFRSVNYYSSIAFDNGREEVYGIKGVYACKKRQMSKSDLKKAGLR